MAFYPKRWKNVIEWAKQYFRVYIACKSGFPNNLVGLQEAKDLLLKALALHQSQGLGDVEPGNMLILSTSRIDFNAYAGYEIGKDMTMLVSFSSSSQPGSISNQLLLPGLC
jgi:hypothetical protein